MAETTRSYRHLNHDGVWPGFSWNGLELGADGALRLMPLPALDGALPANVASLPSQPPPGGVAVDREGTVFYTDPASAALYRIDGCSNTSGRVPCAGGQGTEPTKFLEPSALLIPAHRHALYVADSGNHRIQVFDPDTLALLDILTGFDRPVSLASDDEGSVYVVDTDRRRVDKLSIGGDVEAAFWEAIHDTGRASDPRAVAVDGGLVFILDGETREVCVFDSRGHFVENFATDVASGDVLAVVSGTVYVGDAMRRRLAVFSRDQLGAYVHAGDAAAYEGPVAAVAGDGKGGILVLPGGAIPPLRMTARGSYRQLGWLVSGAIVIDDRAHYWNRLGAQIERPAGSHIQFFVHTGPPSTPPPAPAPGFDAPWRAVPDDATDFFLTFGGGKEQALWIGARFNNDADRTPVLSQIRVDFDQESYLPYLPAIYREDGGEDFLLRYVSLFESFFDEIETTIRRLPAIADPAAAEADTLPWLAGFLALPLPETWSHDVQRGAIAAAYERYARRGTVGGLEEAIRIEAGVRAVIDEPLQTAGWWSMPAPSSSCRAGARGAWTDGGDSILGFNTVLAASEPQGAVVGTTATLDRSQLLTQEEYGTPLFESAAYRFTVRLYPGELTCAGKLEQVRQIVEREKPAHTVYEICVVEPGLRIGYQARLGVDTLIGGRAVPGRLGETALVLGGEPRARIGVGSHLGIGTRL
jgi:phage tail-like protein